MNEQEFINSLSGVGTQNNDIQATAPKKNVIVRKKSLLKKTYEAFIEEDIKEVKNYIIRDVVIPTIKNAIVNTIVGAVEMMFLGTTTSRSFVPSKPVNTQQTNYGKMFVSGGKTSVPNQQAGRMDEEVIFETKAEALEALAEMQMALANEQDVTVASLYQAANTNCTAPYTWSSFGWSDHDLDNAYVKDVWYDTVDPETGRNVRRLGATIITPRPRQLKK